ncbi:MAG: hypothetical protein ABIO58_06135 [Luteimonas sp.]
MPNTYAVQLWIDTTGTTPTEVLTEQVRAADRYEAVALARHLVELQHPQINLARMDTWFVAKRLD